MDASGSTEGYRVQTGKESTCTYQIEKDGLRVSGKTWKLFIPWDDVQEAVLIEPEDTAEKTEASQGVPGYVQLLLVLFRNIKGRNRLMHFYIDAAGAERDQFLAALQSHLPERLVSEPMTYKAAKKRLGYGSAGPMIGAFLLVIIAVSLVLSWVAKSCIS